MINIIDNPILSTNIFIVIFLIVLIISSRKHRESKFFPISVTYELKGFAILAIIFSHIGYFLINDSRFLFPLSILAGVGVNLFLFISGYGLTKVQILKNLSIKDHFVKRFPKLFIPLWITLIVLLIIDLIFLNRSYSLTTIFQSFVGYFNRADLSSSINSPLWYFTLILGYYLILPFVFFKKFPWISALIIYLVSYYFVKHVPSYLPDVIHLYKVHLYAFPLGMIFAFVTNNESIQKIFNSLKTLKALPYYLIMGFLLIVIAYTSYYSNVGNTPIKEELTSLFTMFCVLLVFLIKRFEIRLFSYIGLISYEVYLLHWPILSRYNNLYSILPSWLATLILIILIVILSSYLKKISEYIENKYFSNSN